MPWIGKRSALAAAGIVTAALCCGGCHSGDGDADAHPSASRTKPPRISRTPLTESKLTAVLIKGDDGAGHNFRQQKSPPALPPSVSPSTCGPLKYAEAGYGSAAVSHAMSSDDAESMDPQDIVLAGYRITGAKAFMKSVEVALLQCRSMSWRDTKGDTRSAEITTVSAPHEGEDSVSFMVTQTTLGVDPLYDTAEVVTVVRYGSATATFVSSTVYAKGLSAKARHELIPTPPPGLVKHQVAKLKGALTVS
jgi:hypothetical protein